MEWWRIKLDIHQGLITCIHLKIWFKSSLLYVAFISCEVCLVYRFMFFASPNKINVWQKSLGVWLRFHLVAVYPNYEHFVLFFFGVFLVCFWFNDESPFKVSIYKPKAPGAPCWFGWQSMWHLTGLWVRLHIEYRDYLKKNKSLINLKL